MYSKFKRIFDLFFSILAVIGLAPLLIILAALVRVNIGRGILFSQHRPGRNGRLFKIYKFRTMLDSDPNAPRSDEDRITDFGRFLRATSLDELPSLINIIKGDMSFVGPRPLLVEYLAKYSPEEFRRHDVLPGLSGLAQVRGRNNLSWRNKFRYDLFYVKKIGFLFDMKIILETVIVVITRAGFRSHGEVKKFGDER
jgi:lipopolysaccharide/colanic/teichoic acid biosynthesis glycosyltransferase